MADGTGCKSRESKKMTGGGGVDRTRAGDGAGIEASGSLNFDGGIMIDG